MVAREHGGDVTLKNRDNGGLSALIEQPAAGCIPGQGFLLLERSIDDA